jgi:hypothetical protein
MSEELPEMRDLPSVIEVRRRMMSSDSGQKASSAASSATRLRGTSQDGALAGMQGSAEAA